MNRGKSMKFCPQCGIKRIEKSNFCYECGFNFREGILKQRDLLEEPSSQKDIIEDEQFSINLIKGSKNEPVNTYQEGKLQPVLYKQFGDEEIYKLTFSSDDNFIIAFTNNEIQMWDIQSEEKIIGIQNEGVNSSNSIISLFNKVNHIPKEKYTYFLAEDKICTLDTSTGSISLKTISEIDQFTKFTAISRKGDLIAFVKFSEVLFWSVSEEKVVHKLYTENSIITGVDFSPQADLIAVAYHNEITIWDYWNSKIITKFKAPNILLGGKGIKFSPDGARIACMANDSWEEDGLIFTKTVRQKVVRIYNLNKNNDSENSFFLERSEEFLDYCPSPNSELVGIATNYGVKLLYKRTQNLIKELVGISGNKAKVYFSHGGHFVATTEGRTIKVWKLVD